MTSLINKIYPANLADVIVAIEESDLPEQTRRDLVSAINRVATILDTRPERLFANVPALRAELALVHPARAGISAKSWSNIKAGLTRALTLTGVIRDMKQGEVSVRWNAILRTASERHHVYGLSRLARFCSAEGIDPRDVSDEVVTRFFDHLDYSLIASQPRNVLKATVDTWNLVARNRSDELTLLTPIRERRYRARKLTAYSVPLQKEIQQYLDRLAVTDLFAEDGPTKALRPTSIRNVEAHLRQYLDALATAGYPPRSLYCLADVLQPNMVKVACGTIADRNNGEVPTGLPNIMATILAVARFYVRMPDHQIRQLSRMQRQIAQRVPAGRDAGMGEKSVTRLQQFEDGQNLAALLSLPERLMARAKADPERRYAGLEAMHAVAIAILLAFPVRIQNLASLDVKRHLTSRREGRKKLYSLRIEGPEVKNSAPLDVDLGAEVSGMLDTYLKEFRHLVSCDPGTSLFPQHAGHGPRKPSNLSAELSSRIYRETGLKVHAHLFRHLAAKLYLDQRPGEYETVRRLLGHKKLETTMSFYARLTNKAAAKRYDEVVLKHLRGRKDD
jgi:integrase